MALTSLPILLLDAVWIFGSGLLLFVGMLRAARAEGIPVRFGRLFRAPATPWAPIGLALGSLCIVWVLATLLIPALEAQYGG